MNSLFIGDPSLRNTAAAQHMGMVSSIAFNAREAIRAGQSPDTMAQGPKSKAVARTIRSELMATAILASLLPDSRSLIGAGGESLVFKRGDMVRKLGFGLGSGIILNSVIESHRAAYQVMRDKLGDLVVPTQIQEGELQFRPMRHPVPTVAIMQPYLTGATDVFSGRALSMMESNASLRARALALAEGSLALFEEEGTMVDLQREGNVVVHDEGLQLVDTGIIPSGVHNIVDPYIGKTRVETFHETVGRLLALAA